MSIEKDKIVKVDEWTEKVAQEKEKSKSCLNTAGGSLSCAACISIFVGPLLAISLGITISIVTAVYPLLAMAAIWFATCVVLKKEDDINYQQVQQKLVKI